MLQYALSSSQLTSFFFRGLFHFLSFVKTFADLQIPPDILKVPLLAGALAFGQTETKSETGALVT